MLVLISARALGTAHCAWRAVPYACAVSVNGSDLAISLALVPIASD